MDLVVGTIKDGKFTKVCSLPKTEDTTAGTPKWYLARPKKGAGGYYGTIYNDQPSEAKKNGSNGGKVGSKNTSDIAEIKEEIASLTENMTTLVKALAKSKK